MEQVCALIIDDNEKNNWVLGRLLAQNGVQYAETTDPLQVEALLQAIGHVDVIFLDLQMPTMTGYQVLEAIRANGLQGAKVVACTVHANEINAAREMGFDGFIAKPLDGQRFSDQLARILSGEPVWDYR